MKIRTISISLVALLVILGGRIVNEIGFFKEVPPQKILTAALMPGGEHLSAYDLLEQRGLSVGLPIFVRIFKEPMELEL